MGDSEKQVHKKNKTTMQFLLAHFDEALLHRIIFLCIDSVPSVVPLSLVCKKWQEIIDDKFFWKNLFFKLFDTKITEKENKASERGKDFIFSWKHFWICLWDRRPGFYVRRITGRPDEKDFYVFKPELDFIGESWVVHSNFDFSSVPDYCALAKDFHMLHKIRAFSEHITMGWSECDHPFYPFIFHYGTQDSPPAILKSMKKPRIHDPAVVSIGGTWNVSIAGHDEKNNKNEHEKDTGEGQENDLKEKAFDPRIFLEKIGTHPKLLASEIRFFNFLSGQEAEEHYDDDIPGKIDERDLARWMNVNLPGNISFGIGKGLMNSYPVFILALSPFGTGNVIGVISASMST